MKHVLTGSGVLVGFLLAAGAGAQEQASKPAPDPTALYDRLPAGSFELPKSYSAAPKSIAASEKVDGFYVEVPEHLKRSSEPYRYVQVFGSKEQAEQRNRGTQPSGFITCFTTAFPSMGAELNWSGSLSMSTTVQNYSRNNQAYGNQYGSVQLVRSERIVKETDGRLTYEIKTAYVDSETLGVKLLSTQTKELSLLQEMPGKVRLYGMKSDGEVSLVVFRERHEKERFFFGPISVTNGGMHNSSSSEGCPVSFSLKTGKGVNVASTIQLESVLEIKNSSGEDEDEDADEEEVAGDVPASGKKKFRPISRKFVPAFNQLEAKVRPLRIGVSSTWMSQDTKPVVSVSHGWAGRERTQPM